MKSHGEGWMVALAIALNGCCMGGGAAPAVAPAPAPAPLAVGVPYTVAPGLPVWSESYAARYLNDGTTASYWCTASSPTFPIVTTLSLAGPTPITGIDFDTRVPGYSTSAIRVVTIETLGPAGTLDTQTVALTQDAVSSFSYAAPLTATQLRLTFHANFGGSYAALAELTVRTGPGTGAPAMPTAAPPAPSASLAYTATATLPVWNDTYSAARMQDGQPSTYWCTPMGQTFPFTGTFMLATPGTVTGVLFDNRLPGYDTSGIQALTINAYGPAGDLVTTTSAVLPMATATLVPLPIPVVAARIDVIFTSNYGGQYAGLAEMALR